MKKLPTEILHQIIQYSDTLIRVTLGFPIDKGKLLEEGGPGKVLDEFLRRNGNLEYLKEWIPGECALMHGVLTKEPKKVLEIDRVWNTNMFSNQGYELSVATKFIWGVDYIKHDRKSKAMEEYYAFTRQWEKIEKPINIHRCHPKYLVDIPKEYLDRDGETMVNLYMKRQHGRSYNVYRACLYHGMYKGAVDTASGHDDLIMDLFIAQSIEGLEYSRELNEKELRAYKVAMDPDNEGFHDLDDEEQIICDEITARYYELIPWFHHKSPWDFKDYGWGDTEWNTLLEDALKFNLPGVRNDEIAYAEAKRKDGSFGNIKTEGILEYPNPSCIVVYDIRDVSAVDMALFFWAKYEVE